MAHLHIRHHIALSFIIALLYLFICFIASSISIWKNHSLWSLRAAMTSFDHLGLSSHQSQTHRSHQALLVPLVSSLRVILWLVNCATWWLSEKRLCDNCNQMSVKTNMKQQEGIISILWGGNGPTSSIPSTVSGRQPRVVKLAHLHNLTGSTFYSH